VPLVERPVQFVRAISPDPETGAVRLVFTMPAAPYRYEIDLDSDGLIDADLDPRAPSFDGSRLRGDVVQACLPVGRHQLTILARSGFELTRRLVVPVEVVKAPRCRLWSVIDDPELAQAPRPLGARAVAVPASTGGGVGLEAGYPGPGSLGAMFVEGGAR